jgi:ArsR family transcriptional regulator, nickel/cobalt-responsive transcriptional repressor
MAQSTSPAASCAATMHLLADETRFAVVALLMKKARHVFELNEVLGVEATLLSHHLRVLRDAGLVIAERDGKAVLYRMAPEFRLRPRGRTLDFGCCRLTLN